MQVSYFSMPLSLAGLAVALKIASAWPGPFRIVDAREVVVHDVWYFVFATLSAVLFVCFASLYVGKLIFYPKKVWKEWEHPLHSNGFGMITICIMLYAFLMYDRLNYDSDPHEESAQSVARVFFWIGAVLHTILTIVKTGEWVGRSYELEHIYPQWMILPVGLAVAALVDPVVGAFSNDNAKSVGNHYLARFFFSIAWLMWIALFAITFFKTVTTPNSDERNRHGIWIWVATPCVLGLADFVICSSELEPPFDSAKCTNEFSNFYFIGLFLFLSLSWATMPHINFFGRDPYNAGYWTESFSLSMLAACACFFYSITGYGFNETVEFIFLTVASIANVTAFLHFIMGIIRRRGVFTPEVKWGPLSFMKLTHEAIRGNLPILEQSLELINLDDNSDAGKQSVGLFAAHFNRFVILHQEHSKHEDEVIFKMFNDFFPEHARKYNEDHAEGHAAIAEWCIQANVVLDVSLPLDDRKQALNALKTNFPIFFEHLKHHLRGEEDNLNPIGRKHIPLALAKEMSREVWKMTPAKKWEVIVPFIITNLPRHSQRVRYLKVLTWSMPERAQQIGAMVYRNVDSVTWERLRTELPEIIPRGAPNFHRYF
jgi:tellurite resistance protein